MFTLNQNRAVKSAGLFSAASVEMWWFQIAANREQYDLCSMRTLMHRAETIGTVFKRRKTKWL